MKYILIMSLLLLATTLFAQGALPGGTILPVRLNCSLNSKKSKAGQVITGRIMQNVPRPEKSKIPSGAKVIGRVVDVSPATPANGAKIWLRFDALVISKRHRPITTNLRAIASMMEVHQAQVPEMGADRGTPESAWVTEQIGGEANYHGGWPVTHGSEVVGKSLLSGGVLTRISPGGNCRGEVDNHEQPQALWVFASDACGTYGFADLTIAHAGRTDPVGQIVLTAEKGDINIRSGSGLLLRVVDNRH
jgi:hypothetical protein